MIFIKNIVSWLLPVLIGGYFILLIEQPQMFFILTGILLVALIILWFYLVNWRRHKQRLMLGWSLLLMIIGGTMFFVITEETLIQRLLIIIIVILCGLFTRQIFFYLYLPKKYQLHALENIILYQQIFGLYLLFSGLIILPQLLVWPLSVVLLVVIIMVSVSVAQYLKLKDLSLKTSWPGIFIITLLTAELFWVVQFLPTAFLLGGFMLSLSYFLLIDFAKHILQHTINIKHLRHLFILGIMLFLSTLFTARWR